MIDVLDVGIIVAGIGTVKVMELVISRLYRKVEENYVTSEECKRFRDRCADCIQDIRDRQVALRSHDLPEKYVQKTDFITENRNLRDWMAVIEGKLDRLIERSVR